MFYLSLDIPDTKRRTRPAKTLEDFGDRVHTASLNAYWHFLEKMMDRIHKIISAESDSVCVCALRKM